MSHQSTHHQPNLTAPIKSENDSDNDDVVFLASVPKVQHTPEDYDPECQCSTCQLVRRLLAECTCGECRGQQTNQVNQGQVLESNENVPISNAVSPTNGQPSSSSIQNNDASTNKHLIGNDQHDDQERSSTRDQSRSYYDKSVDSSLDDRKDDDPVDDANHDIELDKGSKRSNSIFQSQTSTSYQNVFVINEGKLNSTDNKLANLDKESIGPTPVKCPKCVKTFTEKCKIVRHYRGVHQEWKPYYCRWPKCNFVSGLDDIVIGHADRTHFNLQNRQKARKYVRKREEIEPYDPVLEQIVCKFDRKKKIICQQCGRNLSPEYMKRHLRTHAKSGYRCAWSNCGFFYSNLKHAKKHLCSDHLQVEQANSAQTNQHLVKVNPKTGKTTKVMVYQRKPRREDNLDNAESDSDDESSFNSSGNDNESANFDNEDPEPNSTTVKCPKCVKTFTEGYKLLRHYRAVHQEWKPYYCRWAKCTFVSAIDDIVVRHVDMRHFNSQNRRKAKKYVGIRNEAPPNDPVLKQIIAIKSFNGKTNRRGQT